MWVKYGYAQRNPIAIVHLYVGGNFLPLFDMAAEDSPAKRRGLSKHASGLCEMRRACVTALPPGDTARTRPSDPCAPKRAGLS